MRVNIYAEEMADRIEIISKEIEGQTFTGLRFYHHPGDDDSAAVTFWGKRDLRKALALAMAMLDNHYAPLSAEPGAPR